MKHSFVNLRMDDADSLIHFRCHVDYCWDTTIFNDTSHISKCQDVRTLEILLPDRYSCNRFRFVV